MDKQKFQGILDFIRCAERPVNSGDIQHSGCTYPFTSDEFHDFCEACFMAPDVIVTRGQCSGSFYAAVQVEDIMLVCVPSITHSYQARRVIPGMKQIC